jgi:hypothetical protein
MVRVKSGQIRGKISPLHDVTSTVQELEQMNWNRVDQETV